MKARTAFRLAWGSWTLIILIMLGVFALMFINRTGSLGDDPVLTVATPIVTLGYATVGALIASRQHRNPIGWLLLTVALGWVLAGLAEGYAQRGLQVAPGSLPAARYAPLLSNVSIMVFLTPILFLLLLFPTGTLPSRRWRPLAWAMGIAASLSLVGFTFTPDEVGGSIQVPNPLAIESLRSVIPIVWTVGGIGSVVSAIAAAAGLVLRFRRSEGEERQQLRWLAYAVGTAAVFFILTISMTILFDPQGDQADPLVLQAFALVFFALTAIGLPAAIGIAILKYRLYDIDVVINKTVVFGGLAAFITVVYVGVVVGIGSLVGRGGEPNLALSILATAVVAVAFQPVRERVQHFANRLVYGKRATPYEVLSQFAERMSSTYGTEDLLPRMAALLGEGTGARSGEVWLKVGTEVRRVASWPLGNGAETPALPVAGDGIPELPGAQRAVPVRHQGEVLGALAISKAAGEPLTPADDKLIQDLASQAGLVLRNVKLIEELRASRQRIVSAQDEERRRIERNIHDGAQQQLVALNVKLGLAKTLAPKDLERTEDLLAQLQTETQDALDNLRDLARGIYPPLLQDKGLLAALEAQARKAPVPVRVEANGVGRFARDAEAAVYFCVLEALQNVAKYARASTAVVQVSTNEGELSFAVRDDGTGFDPSTTPPGSGLTNMKDRIEALGGTLEVRSEPGSGTTVIGRVPIRAEVAS